LIISSCFLFYQADCKNKVSYLCKLDNIVINTLSCSNSIIIVSNASIKNNIATSIMHIHSYSNSVKKTLHHIISSEAELFTIKYSINQAIQSSEVSCIIVITDSIHMTHQIFYSSVHLYQQQLIAISKILVVLQQTFINL